MDAFDFFDSAPEDEEEEQVIVPSNPVQNGNQPGLSRSASNAVTNPENNATATAAKQGAGGSAEKSGRLVGTPEKTTDGHGPGGQSGSAGQAGTASA